MWADCPDVAFIPARLRRVEVFCEFYYNWLKEKGMIE